MRGFWIDSIVRAVQQLGGSASLEDIMPIVKSIRQDKGLTICTTDKNFTATVRAYIEDNSPASKRFKKKRKIFFPTTVIGDGKWSLYKAYTDVPTFSEKPLEKYTEYDIRSLKKQKGGSGGQASTQNDSMEQKIRKEGHYRYEGRLSRSDINKIKAERDFRCQACDMTFADIYPGLGDDFIECHHKLPYADLKEGESRKVNPEDFYVLCPNCHSMIHKLDEPADIEKLKEILLKGKRG